MYYLLKKKKNMSTNSLTNVNQIHCQNKTFNPLLK